MEKSLSKNKVGLAVGGVYAVWHFIWILFVIFGWAYPFLNFVLNLHFLSNPFAINPFAFGNALMLLIVTFVIGYILGWVFAFLWNWLHKSSHA